MSDYAKRRKTLMAQAGSSAIIILPSAAEIIRNGDAHYSFRQQSDFYYMTGFTEPEAIAVFIPKRKAGEYVLFNRVRDRERETWDGPRAGQEGACNDFMVDQAFPIESFASVLSELLADKLTIYYPIGASKWFDDMLMATINQIRSKIRSGSSWPTTFVDVVPLIHEMRLFKSPAEIAVMQRAIDITRDGHLRAIRACRPNKYEYELEAELMYAFRSHNAGNAYTPIVGAGRHSCILHYVSNNHKIAGGDLVLIDAGAEYQHYAADITRTFPANGKFSAEQRAIYELVLQAQLAAIKAIKPGVPFTMMQDVVVKIITQGLIDLGLLKGKLDDLIKKQAYFPFYMHRAGHWLGIDVHDAGRYTVDKKWRPLEPGMVFTVEPGIYISADIPGVPKRWHNIGVRIEDNVVVTEKGCEVMSQHIPKKIDDIEALMN